MVRKIQILEEIIFGLKLWTKQQHTHINGVRLNAVTISLILGKSFWQISIYVKFGHNSEISIFTDWSHNLNIFDAYPHIVADFLCEFTAPYFSLVLRYSPHKWLYQTNLTHKIFQCCASQKKFQNFKKPLKQ